MREMRFVMLLAAVLLVACGGRASTGPAWPKPAEAETDGGESLAPRQPAVVAVEKSEDAKADDGEGDASKDNAAGESEDGDKDGSAGDETDSSAEASADEPDDDEVLTTEDLVIEIEDDE